MSKRIIHGIGVLMVSFLLPLFSLAQTLISGHVVSVADKSPLAGVSVVLKGTKTGVSTNLEGLFTIRAKSGDVLVISGIGVTRQEVTLGEEKDITINAVASSRELNEVVVTALGIKKETKRLGYAIQEVKASERLKAREANPIEYLA